MAGREIVKNIKPVFCRFDMDNEQERRAWQIIQKLSKGEGKKQKYNDIIAKAVVEYYDRAGQMPMKNEELLEKIEISGSNVLQIVLMGQRRSELTSQGKEPAM